MAVAGDVARPAGTDADGPQRLLHRCEHGGVLPHAEIVIRAPDRDLGADAVVESVRKAAAAPFEIGEDTVSPLGAQRTEALSEEALVIHAGPLLVAVILAESKRWLPDPARVW
jgi:hypothetical protein